MNDEKEGKKTLEITCVHLDNKQNPVNLNFREESDGTKNLFAFAGLVLKTLEFGDYDLDVITLQTVLKKRGYFTHPYITDYFGPATEEAVKAFQQDNGLDPIGIVGPATRKLLNGL